MFLDMANVLHIREALWRHKGLGNASVMVGSGFSRNAEPVGPSPPPMPAWWQMAEALCEPLYPDDDLRRQAAAREASGTSGFLRIAQEYKTAFGASALNSRIRSLVPDTQYNPSDLHKRLLRLQWADVFSTNWDTLLERTCADVFERSYDVVRTAGDIPFAARPRIVKLHGTFPSHDPFIFTETDYRTYPREHAPFVNLVQQAMMETIFCLIGFSGDDPNFLHWAGWVHDNLGRNAPKIYLVGWLELSVHRRRMLEERNVMPVDLAGLPHANQWPEHLRHRKSTEWFIAALEQGKRDPVTAWPQPTPPPTPVGSSDLGPIPQRGGAKPVRDPVFSAPTNKAKALREAIPAWQHNRRLYPGWLVAPEHVRSRLWMTTPDWEWAFQALAELSPWERLAALGEWTWRLERALYPLPTSHRADAFEALSAIDFVERSVGGQALPEGASWGDIEFYAEHLAHALARDGRHNLEREVFERAVVFLRTVGEARATALHAAIYEECLWDLGLGALAECSARLRTWTIAEGENVYALRKAGLLTEIGEIASACSVLEAVLARARRTRRRDIDDIASLSLESWALYLALGYTSEASDDFTSPVTQAREAFDRWRDLAVVECDAFSDFKALTRELEGPASRTGPVERHRGFDLNHVSRTIHLVSGRSTRSLNAFQMVLMCETAGLPPRSRHVVLASKGLQAAAVVLADSEPALAAQLAVRLGRKATDLVLTRSWVARLNMPVVLQIVAAMRSHIDRLLAGTSQADRQVDVADKISAAMEILSRLVVRLDGEALDELFKATLDFYRDRHLRRLSPWMGGVLGTLLKRTLNAMTGDQIIAQLPEIFSLPLPSEDGGRNEEDQRWLDPVFYLPSWYRTGNTRLPRDPRWQGIAARILAAAAPGSPDRAAAIGRLYALHRLRALSRTDVAAFNEVLWAREAIGDDGLPQDTGLVPWVLLRMPGGQSQARGALTSKIAQLAALADDPAEALTQIGDILRSFRREGDALELNAPTQAALIALVETWAAERTPHGELHPFGPDEDRAWHAAEGVSDVLDHVTPTIDLQEQIWRKAFAMDEGEDGSIPAVVLYRKLAEYQPNQVYALADRLRRSVLSENDTTARYAIIGLSRWLGRLKRKQDWRPLETVVREVGTIIASRRRASLAVALDLAKWLFEEGPPDLAQQIADDAAFGLSALLTEARYDRQASFEDLPELRVNCVKLAIAMAKFGFTDAPGVVEWISSASEDPLPEVRNVERLIPSDLAEE